MSHLYVVYTHPQRGQWGFTPTPVAGRVRTAFLDGRDGRATMESLDPLKLGPAIQKHVRGGYAKVTQPKYLYLSERHGVEVGEFVSQHPDLGARLDGDRLFFVALPDRTDMGSLVEEWSKRLDACNDVPSRDTWLKHCKSATAYIPVMTTDAGAALVVSEWAKQNNLAIVSEADETFPAAAPSAQRHEWRTFLNQWFELRELDTVLADLGWPLSEAISSVALDPATTTPAEESGDWLAQAQQVSF